MILEDKIKTIWRFSQHSKDVSLLNCVSSYSNGKLIETVEYFYDFRTWSDNHYMPISEDDYAEYYEAKIYNALNQFVGIKRIKSYRQLKEVIKKDYNENGDIIKTQVYSTHLPSTNNSIHKGINYDFDLLLEIEVNGLENVLPERFSSLKTIKDYHYEYDADGRKKTRRILNKDYEYSGLFPEITETIEHFNEYGIRMSVEEFYISADKREKTFTSEYMFIHKTSTIIWRLNYSWEQISIYHFYDNKKLNSIATHNWLTEEDEYGNVSYRPHALIHKRVFDTDGRTIREFNSSNHGEVDKTLTYDDYGNLIEIAVITTDENNGCEFEIEKFKYEYDDYGNWIAKRNHDGKLISYQRREYEVQGLFFDVP